MKEREIELQIICQKCILHKLLYMKGCTNGVPTKSRFFCCTGKFRLDAIYGADPGQLIKIIFESHRRQSSRQTRLWPHYWPCSWIFLFRQVGSRVISIVRKSNYIASQNNCVDIIRRDFYLCCKTFCTILFHLHFVSRIFLSQSQLSRIVLSNIPIREFNVQLSLSRQAIHLAGLPALCYIAIRTQNPHNVQR